MRYILAIVFTAWSSQAEPNPYQRPVLYAQAPALAQIKQPPPPLPVPAVELPYSEIKIEVGDLLEIKPKSAAGNVRWFVSPRAGCGVLPCGNALHFAAKVAGDYTATALTVVGAEISDPYEVKITVVGGTPPGPGPGPPTPADPFPAVLQVAYQADGKPGSQLMQLVSVYKLCPSVINNPTLKKPKDIVDTMHVAIQSLIQDQLPNVRKAIAVELDKTLPRTSADLTSADRALMLAQYSRVQAAMENLK